MHSEVIKSLPFQNHREINELSTPIEAMEDPVIWLPSGEEVDHTLESEGYVRDAEVTCDETVPRRTRKEQEVVFAKTLRAAGLYGDVVVVTSGIDKRQIWVRDNPSTDSLN